MWPSTCCVTLNSRVLSQLCYGKAISVYFSLVPNADWSLGLVVLLRPQPQPHFPSLIVTLDGVKCSKYALASNDKRRIKAARACHEMAEF
jgi:hypothetical protein